jgi:ketosteroid isomerase-like protein
MRRKLLRPSHLVALTAVLAAIAAGALGAESHQRLRGRVVKGSVGGEAHDGYVIRVQKGQRLSVDLSWVAVDDNTASFSVSESPDFFSAEQVSFGAFSGDSKHWSGTAPASKDYYVYVVAHPAADYALDVRAASPTQADLVRDAIEAQNKKFADAFQRKDADAIGALYTSDAKVIPPNAEVVSGREAIAAFWKNQMAIMNTARLTTADVETGGDLAYEYGTAEIEGAQGKNLVRYIVVWKRSKGAWQLHRDIWNSSPGPQPQS